jgi:hypothetical protein
MDGRIPAKGFTSQKQVQDCLQQEIFRLRKSGKWIQEPSGKPITQDELDLILTEEYVKKNPIAQVVVDYLNGLNS